MQSQSKKKISNFYETPSYPNHNFPKFLNVGLLIDYDNNYLNLFKIIKKIEKKLGRIKAKKNDPRIIDIDIIDIDIDTDTDIDTCVCRKREKTRITIQYQLQYNGKFTATIT